MRNWPVLIPAACVFALFSCQAMKLKPEEKPSVVDYSGQELEVVPPATVAENPQQEDNRPIRVVWLGDSQSASPSGFGQEMVQKSILANPVANTTLIARCGANPKWYLDGTQSTSCGSANLGADITKLKSSGILKATVTPKAYTLLSVIKPDLTIIQMGGNLMVGFPDSFITKQSTLLASVAKVNSINGNCIWIGPSERVPVSKAQQNHVNELMRAAISPYCQYFDSISVTHYPRNSKGTALKGDGIHLYRSNGKPFADALDLWEQNALEFIEKVIPN